MVMGLAATLAVLAWSAVQTPVRGQRPEGAMPASASPEVIRFAEVAPQAGLTATNVWGGVTHKKFILETKGNGVGILDYDNDGWLDIYLSNGLRPEEFSPNHEPTNHLYHNNHDGTFTDVTARSGLARSGWQTGVCAGDYDNDGWIDLLLTYYGQNRLFHNNHDGTFTDATERAGLKQSRTRWGTSCSFLDYDRDGNLDIFIANFIAFDPAQTPQPGEAVYCYWKGLPVLCGPRGLPSGTNVLYHNNGNGTFTDVSDASGISRDPGNGLGAVSGDFDNDGWPDIYVSNDSTPSRLYHNNHDGTFQDIGVESGVAYNEDGREQGGMGVAVGDYDNDGWFDIFKTNFAEDIPNLYHNNGNGTFTDQVLKAGLGNITNLVSWGAGLVDVDNDGWKDVFYVNGHVYPEVDAAHIDAGFREPRLLYRNLGDGHFENVSAQSGPAFEERYSSRGCAFGDFDNDGRMDVLIMNMNEKPSLWRNESRNDHAALLVKLVGRRSNRSAVGARVRVVAAGRAQFGEVHSGDSLMSMSDLRLHFGLGNARKVDSLEVKWPATGIVEQLRDIGVNQIVEIHEGLGIVRSTPFGQPSNRSSTPRPHR